MGGVVDPAHARQILTRSLSSFFFVSPQVVTCALDRQVRWLDLDKEQSTHLVTCRQFCSKLAFLPGSPRCFLSAGQDGRVSLFDLREHAAAAERAPTVAVNLSHIGGCTALAFDPSANGNLFAVGCDDPIVRTFDVRRLDLARPSHTAAVFAYAPRELLPSRSNARVYERMASGPSGLAYSATGQLAVNMRGQDVYRFAAMREVLGGTPEMQAEDEVAIEEADEEVYGGDGDVEAVSAGSSSAGKSSKGAVADGAGATTDPAEAEAEVATAMAAEAAEAAAVPAAAAVRGAAAAAAMAAGGASADLPRDGGGGGSASSSGDAAAAPPPPRDTAEEDGEAVGPMDDAVRTFETSFDPVGRMRSRFAPSSSSSSASASRLLGLGRGGRTLDGRVLSEDSVRLVDGVPTLTSVLSTYRGRTNEETFAKEVSFTHDDAYVTTGGDCGRLYVWGTTSARLVYRARGDASIVNCVAPHPHLPLLAVSGIDDDIKLFGLGDGVPPSLRSGGPRRARRPSAARRAASGGRFDGRFPGHYEHERNDDDESSEGWAVDAEPPPPDVVSPEEASAALARAVDLRSSGEEAVRERHLSAAQRSFEAALDECHVTTDDSVTRAALEAEWRTLWIALASVALIKREYAAAVGWCTFALEHPPPPDGWPNAGLNGGPSTAAADGASATEGASVDETVRALQRRAQARRNLGHLDLAQEDVDAALALAPDEPGLMKMRSQLRRMAHQERLLAEIENAADDDNDDDDDDESEEESEESDSEVDAMEEDDEDEEGSEEESEESEESEEMLESVELEDRRRLAEREDVVDEADVAEWESID